MAEWLTYDWQVREQPATFAVDASFRKPLADRPHLLYCAVSSAQPGEPFSPSELRRLEKLETRLLRALPEAVYVGNILLDTVQQFYFYVEDAPEARAAAEAVGDKERKLTVSPGTTEEPEWTTYFHLLYPDTAKRQTIRNATMIFEQAAAGDAIDQPRKLTLHMCFPSDGDMLLFQPAAKDAGFALGSALFYPELELPHVQPLYIITPLLKPAVDEITTRAITAAAPYGGSLLRWVCGRMAKKSPLA